MRGLAGRRAESAQKIGKLASIHESPFSLKFPTLKHGSQPAIWLPFLEKTLARRIDSGSEERPFFREKTPLLNTLDRNMDGQQSAGGQLRGPTERDQACAITRGNLGKTPMDGRIIQLYRLDSEIAFIS
jgi:hypothetical protein